MENDRALRVVNAILRGMQLKEEPRFRYGNGWFGLRWNPSPGINFQYSSVTQKLSIMIPVLGDVYLIPRDDQLLLERVQPVSDKILTKGKFSDAKFCFKRQGEDSSFLWIGEIAETISESEAFTAIQAAIRETQAVGRSPFFEISREQLEKLIDSAPSLDKGDLVRALDSEQNRPHSLLKADYPEISEAVLDEWTERGCLHKSWCYHVGFDSWRFSPEFVSLSAEAVARVVSTQIPYFDFKITLSWIRAGESAGARGGARYR